MSLRASAVTEGRTAARGRIPDRVPISDPPLRSRGVATAWTASAVRLGAVVLGLVLGAGAAWGQVASPSSAGPRVATSGPALPRGPGLRALGCSFVDAQGRVVILRGVNLAGDSKIPPFVSVTDPAALDQLAALGMNVIRLLFIWEAYEPSPGCYDEAYLARLAALADAAWARGLHVIIDFHQDGFARFVDRGCGSGFPLWAVSPRASIHWPDNGCRCKGWVIDLLTDPGVFRSFHDFYSDANGVRMRFLAMVHRVATVMAAHPGVIGYDLLNEPWGSEAGELAPLYRDEAAAIRAAHPTAILFVAGRATANRGRQTHLPRPCFDNFAYAPHYYKPIVILQNGWHGGTHAIDHAFAIMEDKAREWGVPLLVAEFGIPGDAFGATEFIRTHYDRLDAAFLSGTQWNATPHWNPGTRDGWNCEDFAILDPTGRPRPNYRPRPYPRRIAGAPLRFVHCPGSPCSRPSWLLVWEHHPEKGETEVFMPRDLFPPGSAVASDSPGLVWAWDETRQVLRCWGSRREAVTVRVTAP